MSTNHANITLDETSSGWHTVTVTVPTPGDALTARARFTDRDDARRVANDAYRARGDFAGQVRVLVDAATEQAADSLREYGQNDAEYAAYMGANDVFGLCPDGCCGGPEEAIMSTNPADPTVQRAEFYREFRRLVTAV